MLTAQNIRLTIEIKDRSLYLRGTLPARPGSGKTEPYRQRISLGIDAIYQGIKLAEAQKISVCLLAGNFDWGNYIKSDRVEKQTCGYWVEKFKEKIFSTGEEAKRTTTWKGDYWAVFKHLELTIGVMEKVIERSVARSRTRKRYCQVLERLGRFAGIDCDFSHLEGDYGAGSLNPKDIPTDEQIIKTYDRLTNPQWHFGGLWYQTIGDSSDRSGGIAKIDCDWGEDRGKRSLPHTC